MQHHQVGLKVRCRSAVASTPWNWCSRQEWASQALRVGCPKRNGLLSRIVMHLHWRRSRRRAAALGYASCWRSAIKNGASSRCCPGRIALQKPSAGSCMEAGRILSALTAIASHENRSILWKPLEPSEDRFIQLHGLAVRIRSHMTERGFQVIVVEN